MMCFARRIDVVEAKQIGTNGKYDDILIIRFWDVRDDSAPY